MASNSSNPADNIAPGSIFCVGCGATVVQTAAFCPQCGTPRAVPSLTPQVPVAPAVPVAPNATGAPSSVPYAPPKSKTPAVILAIFLGYWTWLYTYQKDAWKFWLSIAVAFLIALPLTFATGFGFLITLGIGVWAIIDTAVKPREYYTNYPNYPNNL